MRSFKYWSFLLLFVFIQIQLKAQVTNGIVKGMLVDVETKDGMTLIGHVESISGETLVLTYETYGEISLKTNRLKSIKQISEKTIKNNEYWHVNTNYSRNFYGPTGLGMEKGMGYYQNIMLVWNHVAYAFTDYFTLGVDFEIVTMLVRLSGEEIFDYPIPITGLTPKFSFRVTDNFHMGTGAWMIFVPQGEYLLDFGIGYVVGTVGNTDNNFTIGLGLTYFENSMHLDAPILTISGQTRVSKSFSLVTENWFFLTDNSIIETSGYLGVHGIRYLARKLTWDFGLILAIGGGESTFVPIPYIGIAFPFNK